MGTNLIGEYNVKNATWPIGAGLQTSGWVVTNSLGIVVFRGRTIEEARRWADEAAVKSYDG